MTKAKVLEVPATIYAAMRALLEAAGHLPAPADGDPELLDMHGIALRSRGGRKNDDIVVGTLLSARTKEGRVELAVNDEATQMDLAKAREVVGMLQEAIEAAVSDQLIYAFLTQKVGLSDGSASRALLDFRELRQGSREIVRPS
jgi:hypothetical protein